ncbi:MAG: DUF3800 domain-containing protein [Candidatus Gracilibacteria bacterium]|nr:DUF3800 domain-containing protein [Candidatus Gracilibacteria bacterium]
MKYIYLDESGDLGFDFENKKPSDFFTITIILVKDIESNKALKKEIEVVLKRKLNTKLKSKRIIKEIKGSKTTLEIKKYLYNRVKNLNFDIYSISFNKRNVYDSLQNNKPRLYNYFVKQLIDNVDFSEVQTKLTIVLDKSKNKEQIKDCNDYLIRNIEGILPLEVNIDIIHENSEVYKQLQIADVFCYGFYEKHNKNKTDWFDIFSEKVKYHDLWYDKAKK